MYLKKKDPGLSYIRRIGITPAASMESLIMSIERTCGTEKKDDFFNNYPEDGENKEFYEYKNRDEKLAYLFTGGFDADIIRQSANWVFEHKEAFGKEILEIGCDIGFMTGFLAITFPDSHITAIDRSQNSIALAEKFLDTLHVTNVELICTDIESLDKERTFDTILSMRCLNENIDGDELRIPTFDVLMDDLENRFIPAVQSYMLPIRWHLSAEGTLVSITNAALNSVLIAWMMLHDMLGLEIQRDSYRKYTCKGPNPQPPMQAFYAKGKYTEEDLSKESDEEKVKKILSTYTWAAKNIVEDPSAPIFENMAAEIMRFDLMGDLVEGIAITNPSGKVLAKYCLYTDRIDPTAVLLYHANLEASHLEIYDISEMDKIKKELHNIRDLNKPDVKYVIETEHCSMWLVIKNTGKVNSEIIDYDHKIH